MVASSKRVVLGILGVGALLCLGTCAAGGAFLSLVPCFPLSFESPPVVCRSSHYTIHSDSALADTIGPRLDRYVAQISSDLALPLPADASLHAIAFADEADLAAFYLAHEEGEIPGAFCCTEGGEIAFPIATLQLEQLVETLDETTQLMDELTAVLAEVAEVTSTTPGDGTSLNHERLDRLREGLAEDVDRARPLKLWELHALVHEIVHQVIHTVAPGERWLWAEEGLAELEALRALATEVFSPADREAWLRLRQRLEASAALVLAARLLYGVPVFPSGQPAAVSWDDENYTAHLGLARYLADAHPAALAAIVQGRELERPEVVFDETAIYRWACARVTEALEQLGTQQAAAVLTWLWEGSERGSGTPRTLQQRAAAGPRALPALLDEARAALQPLTEALLDDPADLDLATLEAAFTDR